MLIIIKHGVSIARIAKRCGIRGWCNFTAEQRCVADTSAVSISRAPAMAGAHGAPVSSGPRGKCRPAMPPGQRTPAAEGVRARLEARAAARVLRALVDGRGLQQYCGATSENGLAMSQDIE